MIGGDYIGVEMVEALRHRGLRVSLVEMKEEIIPQLDHEMDRAPAPVSGPYSGDGA